MKSDFCCDEGQTEKSKKKGRMFLSFLFLGALLLAFTPTAVFAAPGDACVSDAECPGGTCDFGANPASRVPSANGRNQVYCQSIKPVR